MNLDVNKCDEDCLRIKFVSTSTNRFTATMDFVRTNDEGKLEKSKNEWKSDCTLSTN